MNFELHPNLKEKIHVLDLDLCRIFLENEKNYPWILLVPMKPEIKKIIDLHPEDQLLLYQEMS
jgi:diadenosine tetraphosphate (Ap4A) HIT family hydrolase